MLMQQNPTPPSSPDIVVRGGSQGGQFTIAAPRTSRDIDALKARREELSNQLTSVDGRRKKLMDQLRQTGDQTATKGLQDRLALLDARQLQLESDLAQTGQQLSSGAAGQIATTSSPFVDGFSSKQTMTLSVLSILFILFPISIGIARTIWKRGSRQGPPPAVFAQTAERLERLEGSVDAIAIEIERISEGQRFVTKLLSQEHAVPKLVAGQRTSEAM
jgi:hypothetical protein